MALSSHLIYTGTFAALETRFLETIAEEQREDPLAPVAVLVGSNILASYLNGRIAECGRAAANLRFHTFRDLVGKLRAAADVGRPGPQLSRLGSILILEDCLAAQTPDVFKPVAGFAGFRGALLDTFRDLRDAGISPEALEASLPAVKGLAPDRRNRLVSLASLYRRFEAATASYENSGDSFRRAVTAATHAARALGARTLLVYGLYDVTGLQADLLRALKSAMSLVYFVPYTGEAASGFAGSFLEARVLELGVEPLVAASDAGLDGIAKLAHRVFAFPVSQGDKGGREPLEADGTFSLVSVPGESRTAVEVVREVFRAVRDGVIKGFHEAAVVLRHADEDVPVLAETFRLRGVPYFIHGGSAFSRRPLARAALAVAGLQAEFFTRRAILTAMELIAAALPEPSAGAWDVPQWYPLVNDARFIAGVASWDAGANALVKEMREQLRLAEAHAATDEDGEEEGRRTVSPMQAERRLESAESLRAAWIALRQAASDWPLSLGWDGWAKLLQGRLEPLLGRAKDWDSFSAVLDDIRSVGGLLRTEARRDQVTGERIRAALAEALADLSYEEGGFQRRGVNLLSTAAARGLRFPLVIIPGLEEGRFPSRLRQDPLLLDAERLQIGNPARLHLKSLRIEEEKLLFDMAVRSATKRLVLMTSRLDESSDRERIPSQFFLRAAAAARGASLNLGDLIPERVPGLRSVSLDEPGPGKGQIAVDEGEIRLGLITEERAGARAALAALAQAVPQLLRGPLAYDHARWARQLTEFDGRILDSRLWPFLERKLITESPQLSASRIEEYAKCPYLFFLRRVLELERWEEEDRIEGMDPLLRGQMVHEILEGFLGEFAREKFSATPLPVLQEALSARSLRVLDAGRPGGMPDLLWEIERDRLLGALQNWLQFERDRAGAGWLPSYMERTFGTFPGNDATPPYRVQGRNCAFDFRGRIDRVDLSPDGRSARVVDYKTGALPKSMGPRERTLLMGGEKVQLAIYCGALSVMGDLKSVEHVEGEYLHIQPYDGEVVPCIYSDGDLRAAAERLPEMLEIVREGASGGVFFARTSGSVRPDGHCEWCDYLTICGKDRVSRERAKAADPAVARFNELHEIDGAAQEDEE